jgi:hypothetical protein
MTHKCDYAEVIGAAPEWITDTASGRVVCSLCHAPKTTKTIEVPVETEEPEPVKAPAPKTTARK